jgi:hypothetical protein
MPELNKNFFAENLSKDIYFAFFINANMPLASDIPTSTVLSFMASAI